MRTPMMLLSLVALARAAFVAAVQLSAVAGAELWLVQRELHAESALVGQAVVLVVALLLFGPWAFWLVTGSLVSSVAGVLGFAQLSVTAWRARDS